MLFLRLIGQEGGFDSRLPKHFNQFSTLMHLQ